MHNKNIVIPKPGSYFTALDGLRGLGLLAVMFGHFGERWGEYPQGWLERAYFSLSATCWIALELFFVLSGFLITGILLDTKKREGFFSNFFLRRFLRIFPLYYLCLAVIFIALRGPLQHMPGFDVLHADQFWFWTYLQNWAIALHGDWYAFHPLNHFWSLAVEEQFYLVWPFVIFYLDERKLVPLCLAMMAAAVCWRIGVRIEGSPIAAYTTTIARLDSLAIGSLLAVVARREGGMAFLAKWCGYGATVSFAAILALLKFRHTVFCWDAGVQTFGYFMTGIFGACSILYLITRSDTNLAVRFFRNKALVFVGMISYGAYLIHLPVLYMIRDVVHLPAFVPRLLGHVIYFSLILATTFGISTVLWFGFEKRVVRLKDILAPSRSTNSSKLARLGGPTSST